MPDFQVALTYASEQLELVAAVADRLAASLGREQVFFDRYHVADLARPNLDHLLQEIYHRRSRLVVPFLGQDYVRKKWTSLEGRAVRALIFDQADERLLLVRVDDSDVPGIFKQDGYLDARQLDPHVIADHILQRLRQAAASREPDATPLVAPAEPAPTEPPPAQEPGDAPPPRPIPDPGAELARAIRQGGPQEYRLLEQRWHLWAERRPVSLDRLAQQAASLLDEAATYPWTIRDLRQAGFADRDLAGLRNQGVLRIAAIRGTVELVEPRDLRWAVAAGILSSWRAGAIDREALVQRGLACLAPVTRPRQPWLGEAAFDLLWQLCADQETLEEAVTYLATLEPDERGGHLVHASWQLGERGVPALFARLRATATGDTSWSIAYVGVLRRIARQGAAAAIAQRALAFLTDPEPLRGIGVSILAFAPTPAALDRLWELRCQHRDERALALQSELDSALGACVRGNGAWLESRLRAADPAHEPVEALVYLLLHLEDGAEIWRRLRDDVILPRTGGAGDRAIAYCAFQFRDRTMIGWLRQHLDSTHDAVGPAALRALLFLEPESELPALPPEALELTVSFKDWWLLLYLTAAETRAHQWVRSIFETYEEPSWIGTIYNRLETWMPAAFAESLLGRAEQRLAQEAAHPSDGRALYRPLSILAGMSRPDLLRLFERRRDTAFEADLAAFLIRLGPPDEGWARQVDDEGFAVLLKIGGSGYARVATSYLKSARTPLGQRLAIETAVRGILPEGLDQLAEWVTGPQREPELRATDPRIQGLRLLAAAGRYGAVVQGIVRFGLLVPRDLDRYLEGIQLSDSDLAPALASFNGAATPAGAVLAVGFGHRVDLAPQVRALMQLPDLPSDVVIAGLLALAILRDDSAEAEALLLAHLHGPETRFAASRGLLRLVHRPAVLQALLAELERLGEERPSTSMDSLPFELLDLEETRAAAARILWDRFAPRLRLFFVGQAVEHLSVLGAEAKPLLHEVATGQELRPASGSRASAIRGLSALDRDAAFEAAKELLADTAADERRWAPRLLLELDAVRALPLLSQALTDDDDLELLAAIGEALDRAVPPPPHPPLDDWLDAPDPRLRLGACLAAEAASWTADRERLILERQYDPDWDVRLAAASALEPIRRARQLEAVLVELEHPDCREDRRWALLDAAQTIGHPGIVYTPSWFERIRPRLPYPARRFLADAINDRKKALREDLGRRERPGQ